MLPKIFSTIALAGLIVQASTSFAQQANTNDNHGENQTSDAAWVIENITTYETVCRDEVKSATVNTGKSTCDINSNEAVKSADFSGNGRCDPITETVETMIPVCKQVPKVTQVWVKK